jgi:hypothetical protein
MAGDRGTDVLYRKQCLQDAREGITEGGGNSCGAGTARSIADYSIFQQIITIHLQ